MRSIKALAFAGTAVSLLVIESAAAAFVNFSTEASIQSDGKLVSQIYANFTLASDAVVCVVGLEYLGGVGTSGMGVGNFYHRDLFNGLQYSSTSGSWSPQLTTSDGMGADSFVTAGGQPGFTNTTTAGIGWGGYNSAGLDSNSGWCDGALSGQGQAGADLKVLMAQFVTDQDKSWRIATTFGYYQGFGTPQTFVTGEMSFGIPAPGVLAALLLPLMGSTRRRR